MSPQDEHAYNELSSYTLSHPNLSLFIHQYFVDAYTAQNADTSTKPIAVTFALVGLYLTVEKHYTGKQVQRVHTLLANKRTHWPQFPQPTDRGSITISDILAAEAGEKRDDMILAWCASVWSAWQNSHQQIRDLIHSELR